MESFEGQRLRKFIDFYKIKQTHFAKNIGVPANEISVILNGHRGISKSILKNIRICYPELNTDWILFGDGEMLKSPVSDTNFETGDTRIKENIKYIIEETGGISALAARININDNILTDLVESGRPTLWLLIRLRNSLSIKIDDLLFSDLTVTGMENLEIAIQQILKKMENIERQNHALTKRLAALENKVHSIEVASAGEQNSAKSLPKTQHVKQN